MDMVSGLTVTTDRVRYSMGHFYGVWMDGKKLHMAMDVSRNKMMDTFSCLAASIMIHLRWFSKWFNNYHKPHAIRVTTICSFVFRSA